VALVKKIRVQHVRTHKNHQADISSDVTVITGPNGAGKTSLIEALHIALQGSSFKGVDGDILRRNAPWYRIDVWFDDGSVRTVKFDPDRTAGRKQFIINEKINYRLPPQHKYPVVLFEPDDLRLLDGSPARRRQFIDRFIAQIDPLYSKALRRYERALKQRNTLLKRSHVADDDLFAWNVSLSEYGAYITTQRLHFIDELNQQLNETYRIIARIDDTVGVRYSLPSTPSIQQKLLADLHSHTEKDKILGFTSTGPHRHDVLFDFNHSLALQVASRGEIRSIILALKFLEVHIIERLTGKKPIILLDDVFSELDETRQKNLVTEFTDHQIIVTSVGAIPIESSTVITLTA
jgi:DNA replication and repair protein RecF